MTLRSFGASSSVPPGAQGGRPCDNRRVSEDGVGGIRQPDAPAPGGAATERHHMSGDTDKTKGKIKEAAGDLTGNDDLEREGKADKAGGKIKNAIDDVKDKITGND